MITTGQNLAVVESRPAGRVSAYPGSVPERDPLVELLDQSRMGERVATRIRERALCRAAEEGATFAGLLVDLAERGSTVVVHTVTGRRHHGGLVVVGADYCVIRTASGAEPHLRLDCLATVLPSQDERHAPPTGDRAPVVDQLLVEVLGRAVDQRPRVVLIVRGGGRVAGELRSVGADVVTVALDGGRQHLCFVAAATITEAVLDQ